MNYLPMDALREVKNLVFIRAFAFAVDEYWTPFHSLLVVIYIAKISQTLPEASRWGKQTDYPKVPTAQNIAHCFHMALNLTQDSADMGHIPSRRASGSWLDSGKKHRPLKLHH